MSYGGGASSPVQMWLGFLRDVVRREFWFVVREQTLRGKQNKCNCYAANTSPMNVTNSQKGG